jgi:hypothetical protein
MRSSFLPAGAVWLALTAAVCCGAQQRPVSVTLHVTNQKGSAVSNAAVSIADGSDNPFAHFRSNAHGLVTVPLLPGAHDLRIQVSGYALASQHVDVSTPMLLDIALAAKGSGENTAPAAPASNPVSKPSKAVASKHSAAPAGGLNALNPLAAYNSCFFSDGLQIQLIEPLDAEQDARPMKTSHGFVTVPFLSGERIMFAYPFMDYYANMSVEQLPADRYASLKATMLDNMAYLESEINGPAPAQTLPEDVHGFEVHGNNREKMEGGALGMYLLFDDLNHVATTVYFLNEESWRRKFQTMDEYARLRDQFLTTYTGCVRQNQAIGK